MVLVFDPCILACGHEVGALRTILQRNGWPQDIVKKVLGVPTMPLETTDTVAAEYFINSGTMSIFGRGNSQACSWAMRKIGGRASLLICLSLPFLLRRTSLAQIVSARQSYLPAAGVIRAAAGGPVGTGRRQDVVGMLDKAPVVPHNGLEDSGLEDSGLEDSETQQER